MGKRKTNAFKGLLQNVTLKGVLKMKPNQLLIVTEANYEHPFEVGTIVKVLEVKEHTLIFVKDVEFGITGYLIKGEYQLKH